MTVTLRHLFRGTLVNSGYFKGFSQNGADPKTGKKPIYTQKVHKLTICNNLNF